MNLGGHHRFIRGFAAALAFLSVCSFVPRPAVADSGDTLRWGVNLGFHSAYMDGVESFDDEGHRTAFRTTQGLFGLALQWRFSRFLGLDTGFHAVGRGYERHPWMWLVVERDGQEKRVSPNEAVSLRYFHLPLLVSVFPFGDLGSVAPKMSVGPYASVLYVTNLDKYDGDPLAAVKLREEDLNRFDAGVVVAIGVDVAMEWATLTVALRYEQGLTDVHLSDAHERYHESFGMKLGLLF